MATGLTAAWIQKELLYPLVFLNKLQSDSKRALGGKCGTGVAKTEGVERGTTNSIHSHSRSFRILSTHINN